MPNDFTVTSEALFKYVPKDVVEAINREREHQILKYGEDGEEHTVEAFMYLMERELVSAQVGLVMSDEDEALAQVLQVITLGVACLTRHGVVERPDRAGVVRLVTSPDTGALANQAEPEQPEKQP